MTVCGVGTHSHADRGDDFYPTPAEAVHALLAAEKKWLPHTGRIWEPACGDGAISRVLYSQLSQPIWSTDLVHRGYGDVFDFLAPVQPPVGPVSAIITNPPFKLAREFVDQALRLSPYVAMLLRLAFLEGAARKPWFENLPLARVHVASRRLPMMHRHGWAGPKAGSAVCHAWFVWDIRHEGRPQIQWFDWKEHVPAANNNEREREAA